MTDTTSADGAPHLAGFDVEQVDRLLSTTRSVRKRLDLTRPVDRRIILDCIDVAVQAPNGANTQKWRWVVLDDPDKKAEIAAIYRRGYQPYIEARRSLGQVEGGLDRPDAASAAAIISSSDHLAAVLHQVPALVIPCVLERLNANPSVSDQAALYGSILPAAWSFMLALRARGLGSAWTSLHLEHEQEASAVLGIPSTVTQVALIPVAYYTGSDFQPARRRPAAEITYWNAWRNSR